MANKKIVIDGCEHCPLKEVQRIPVIIDGRNVYYVCQHPHIEGADVTEAVDDHVIYGDCPLIDDPEE